MVAPKSKTDITKGPTPGESSRSECIFNAVRATAHFEKSLSELLHTLAESQDVYLKLVVVNEECQRDRLQPAEMSDFEAIANTARQASWLTGRNALKHVMDRCSLEDDTSTLRFPHPNFSLTHSGTVAIAVNARLAPATDANCYELSGTGIDYEAPRSINPKTAKFFLRSPELQKMGVTSPEQLDQQALLRLWTIKEAVFKADASNNGKVLGQYALDNPLAEVGWAHHEDNKDISFAYSSLHLDLGTISLALALRTRTI